MRYLGDIVEIVKGNKATQVFNEPQIGTRRYLQIDDLRPGSTKKYAYDANGVLATRNDVLIAWDGANAGTVGFKLEGYAGSTIAVLKSKSSDLYGPFLGYFLHSKFQYLQDNCTGATIPHINRGSLDKLQLHLPHFAEQKRIAVILEKAERLCRQHGYELELSDTYLQTVFLEMFYQTANKNWPNVSIESLVKNKKNAIRTGPFGSQLLHSEFVDRGIAVLGIDNAVRNRFSWGVRRFITEEKYIQLKRYTVFPGDVIITIMGTPGRCAVIPDNFPLAINTKHLCCITLDKDQCLPDFLKFCFLTHPLALRQLNVSERGAVMPGLNMEIIKELVIPRPPISLQQKFAQIVKKYERLHAQQREAERQAEHLFLTLLHRAFQEELVLEDGAADMTEEQTLDANTPGIEYKLTAPAKLVAEETAQLALPME